MTTVNPTQSKVSPAATTPTQSSAGGQPVAGWKPSKSPLAGLLNPRVLIFAALAIALLGFPIYVFLDDAISGGIHDRGSYLEVDLKTMSNFEMDQHTATDEDVPKKWRDLNGKRVALVGELYSAQSAGGSGGAVDLVYSIAKCCFSGPPKVQHFVRIIPTARSVEFVGGLVTVTGTLRVKVEKSDGAVQRVYSLEADSVEAVR